MFENGKFALEKPTLFRHTTCIHGYSSVMLATATTMVGHCKACCKESEPL